jgi:hypothetical protein
METRTLLVRIAEALATDADDLRAPVPHPEDRAHRRTDGSYFNPSPEEILAATLSIRAQWSEDEWQKRGGELNRSRRWRVPRVRAVVTSDPDA